MTKEAEKISITLSSTLELSVTDDLTDTVKMAADELLKFFKRKAVMDDDHTT